MFTAVATDTVVVATTTVQADSAAVATDTVTTRCENTIDMFFNEEKEK